MKCGGWQLTIYSPSTLTLPGTCFGNTEYFSTSFCMTSDAETSSSFSPVRREYRCAARALTVGFSKAMFWLTFLPPVLSSRAILRHRVAACSESSPKLKTSVSSASSLGSSRPMMEMKASRTNSRVSSRDSFRPALGSLWIDSSSAYSASISGANWRRNARRMVVPLSVSGYLVPAGRMRTASRVMRAYVGTWSLPVWTCGHT